MVKPLVLTGNVAIRVPTQTATLESQIKPNREEAKCFFPKLILCFVQLKIEKTRQKEQ